MANPLLKMTLMLISLLSASLVGYGFMDAEPSRSQAIQVVSLSHLEARAPRDDKPVTQNTNHEAVTPAEATPNQQRRKHQRSFSFHYLDILEWLFAGRGEKAKQHQLHRPSTLHAG